MRNHGEVNMIRNKVKCLLLIIISFFNIKTCQAISFKDDYTHLYKKINPAVVTVDTQVQDGISCGTGCIIDKNGTILTSSHVINYGEEIVVTTYNGKNYTAKLIANLGEKNDIALIKITADETFATMKLGNSEKIQVGEKVLAIGNPFGFNGTLTQGIISRIDYVKNRIQTDAAINPGSSGGPLLNTKGEIIGINQAIYNPDNNISNIGIGFATPINTVKEYLEKY